jgi:hypothetical protein
MGTRWIVVTLMATAGVVGVGLAQEAEFTPVASPFQNGYPYEIGDDLAPNVDIEGLRWTLVKVSTRTDRDIAADKEIPVVVDLEFENRRDSAVDVLVVLLLENDDGDPLERVRCDPIRAGAERFKSARQRARLPGSALLETRRLYLFCEIQD